MLIAGLLPGLRYTPYGIKQISLRVFLGEKYTCLEAPECSQAQIQASSLIPDFSKVQEPKGRNLDFIPNWASGM